MKFSLNGKWEMRNVSDNEWMPAIVPGSVFKDLLANNAIKLYCANETMQSHDCVINCRLLKYDGTVIFDKSAIAELQPLSAKEYYSLDLSQHLYSDEDKRNIYAEFELRENGEVISRGTEMFCPAKHIELKNPKITATVEQQNDTFYITLSAAAPAFFTELVLDGYDTVFSDNCFYISPDKPIIVSIKKGVIVAALTEKEIENLLKIRSLFDTYE